MGGRQLGSTRAAKFLGWSLCVMGGALLAGTVLHIPFSWKSWEIRIDIAACLVFGSVLIWWAGSYPAANHVPASGGRIGNPTVTMTVGVLTALVAVFTLVDGAAHNQESGEQVKAEYAALEAAARNLALAADKLSAAEREIELQRSATAKAPPAPIIETPALVPDGDASHRKEKASTPRPRGSDRPPNR